MEIWDLYDLEGNVVGAHVRGNPMPGNAYHRVVHIWIRNRDGKFLLTQRSPQKKTFPLKWECVGGSVLQGEESLHAALREVKEEVGLCLDPAQGRLVLTQVREICGDTRVNDINDIYLFMYDGDIDLSAATTDEVAQVKWMGREEILELFHREEMVSVIKDLTYFIEDKEGVFGKEDHRSRLRKLYLDQKRTLDTFLANGAITKAQYDKSLGDLTVKMGMENEAEP